MAGIDHSIYFQQQTPDILGNVQKGLSMRDMMDQRQRLKADQERQAGIQNAYKAGLVTNPDGTTTIDRAKTMSALTGVGAGKEAMEFEEKALAFDAAKTKADFDKQFQTMEMTARLLGNATDQASWEKSLAEAQKFGINVSDEPKFFDPGYRDHLLAKSVSYLDRLRLEKEKREEQRREREVRAAEKAAGNEAAWKNEQRKNEREKWEKEKTELGATQAKQVGLYNIGAKAEEQFNKAVADKNEYDPTGVGQWIDNSEWAPAWMKNSKAVEAQAAQANWVESFLRDASGAAIPPSERMAYAKDFFPQPGDTPEVVANKAEMRKQKMQNALIGAGPNASQYANSSMPETKQINGEMYQKVNGGWQRVEKVGKR
jgi:hypothetical protein